MLMIWARFQSREYKETDWPSTSMTARMGMAHGSSHEIYDNNAMDYIELMHHHIQLALPYLSEAHRKIIRIEYTDRRGRRKKLHLVDVKTITAYRAKLCRARKMLMQIV